MARAYDDAVDSEAERLERRSGIPKPGRLGASRNEVIGLLLALVVLAAIGIGFWFEATH